MDTQYPIKCLIYGTTIYIGSTDIDTKFGSFKCLIFQDSMTKAYIIAIIHGDINQNPLYTRIHSSCVTSETLRSLDCDCVNQLEGTLEIIGKNNGILFYLIQEGRGCGYVGKSRACMLVQYSKDEITTFDAYSKLGMIKDYRSYHNVKEILIMIGIYENAEFILLTNNPDKINAFQSLNIKLIKTQSIEYEPNAFNMSYLISKKNTGHKLSKLDRHTYTELPFQRIEPFDPFVIDKNRFIYCASYYIPIKPVSKWTIIDDQNFVQIMENVKYKQLDNNKILVQWMGNNTRPYWFRVYMYYDIVSSQDYVILEYKNDNFTNLNPIVRIHSESILNRFSLKDPKYKRRYKTSILKIVENGYGYIVLFYADGRGYGLGNYILNKNYYNGHYGIKIDNRDYGAVTQLLKYHVKEKPVILLYSDTTKLKIESEFHLQNIRIQKMINVDVLNEIIIEDYKMKFNVDIIGLNSIKNRVNNFPNVMNEYVMQKNIKNDDLKLLNEMLSKQLIVSGLGSSEFHAKYFVHKFSHLNVRFSLMHEYVKYNQLKDKVLICFSQGLSPNVCNILENWNSDMILFTACREKKSELISKLNEKNRIVIVDFPHDDPDDTLVRITGVKLCYVAIDKLYSELYNVEFKNYVINISVPKVGDLINKQIYLIVDDIDMFGNIRNKLMETLFGSKVFMIDYLNFVHGHFQSSLYDTNVEYLLIPTDEVANEKYMIGIKNMIPEIIILHKCESKNRCEKIIYYDYMFDQIIIEQLENIKDNDMKIKMNQSNWKGKNVQHLVYEL